MCGERGYARFRVGGRYSLTTFGFQQTRFVYSRGTLTLHLFFARELHACSNTDKMSDAEKLPIAIAGLVFISLPFLAGMIALYASK